MNLPSRICALVRPSLHTILLLVMLTACASEKTASEPLGLEDFATQYTAAWCSHNATVVASFFDPAGSLQINQGSPAVGRRAIRASVQKFMAALPDLIVTMDTVTGDSSQATYHWTLTGTNTAPGGTGKSVRISGYEEWRFGADHHIVESKGHFDEADYRRQLKTGAVSSP
jgi:SnoaL-like domain